MKGYTFKHGITSCIAIGTPEGTTWTAVALGSGTSWHREANLATSTSYPPLPAEVVEWVDDRFESFSSLTIAERSAACSHRVRDLIL